MEDLHGLFSHDSINKSGNVCGKRQTNHLSVTEFQVNPILKDPHTIQFMKY